MTTPHIDLPADLHFEDNEGRNMARVENTDDPGLLRIGNYLTAGSGQAWSWVCIEELEGEWVHFRQVSARDAIQALTRQRDEASLWARTLWLHAMSGPLGLPAQLEDTAPHWLREGTPQ